MRLSDINVVTLLLACLFFIPIVYGVLRSFSGERVRGLFISLFNNIGLLVSVVLAICLTSVIFSDSGHEFLSTIRSVVQNVSIMISGKIAWSSIILIVLLTAVIDILLHVLMIPVYRHIVVPLSEKISSAVHSMKDCGKRIIGGLWQLPQSIWLVLVFSLILSGYAGFYSGSFIAENAQSSVPYQLIKKNVIQPLLRSSVVRDIQVLFNDTFNQAVGESPESAFDAPLIKYFNGVTLDEAVQSNSQIDAKTLEVIGSARTDREKAHRIYQWICKNIEYDSDKAASLSRDSSQVSSGAVVAFEKRSGVCFDYSCLYVAMCRKAGLRVRFVTGSGFSGTVWGDHAWNQVYDSNENAWINVDTTFGSTDPNYFGNSDFDADHSGGTIQGEWYDGDGARANCMGFIRKRRWNNERRSVIMNLYGC